MSERRGECPCPPPPFCVLASYRICASYFRVILTSLSSHPVADGPLELPLFQLIPTQRQLVFRGDRLPLQCTASSLDPSVELRWLHDGRAVTTLEDGGVSVEETLLHDCCLLTRYSQRDGSAACRHLPAGRLQRSSARGRSRGAGGRLHTPAVTDAGS